MSTWAELVVLVAVVGVLDSWHEGTPKRPHIEMSLDKTEHLLGRCGSGLLALLK